MKEKLLQELIINFPSEILEEPGLTYLKREVKTGNNRLDIILLDRRGRHVLVEVQSGSPDTNHIDRRIDFSEGYLQDNPNTDIRILYVANYIDIIRKNFLQRRAHEYKEISEAKFREVALVHGYSVDTGIDLPGKSQFTTYSAIETNLNQERSQLQPIGVPANSKSSITTKSSSSESSAFKLFKYQQELFSKALREYDPSIWFPSLRGNFKEQDRGNWFICFIPGAWGRWKSKRYGVHFDFICAPAKKDLPERFRLAIGVESPLIEQQRQVFKEDVIAQVSAKGIVQSGFVLQSKDHKKLLEADPIPFDNQSWKVAIEKYVALEPVVSVIAQLVRDFYMQGAFDEAMEF